MIAEHPLQGIPLNSLGRTYAAWYQPLDYHDSCNTFLNDCLTIAGAAGLPAATLCLAAFLFLIGSGSILGMRLHNSRSGLLAVYCAMSLTAYGVAVLFNTFFRFPMVTILPIGTALALALLLICNRKVIPLPCLLKTAACTVSLSVLIAVAVFLYGLQVNHRQSFQRVLLTLPDETQTWYLQARNPIGTLICILPVGGLSQGTCQINPPNDLAFIRTILRPAADEGFNVLAAEIYDGVTGVEEIHNLVKFLDDKHISGNNSIPLIFLSWPDTSLQLLAAANAFPEDKQSALAVMGLPYSWPIEELSPDKLVINNRLPLLLFAETNAAPDARKLQELALKSSPAILEIKEVDSYQDFDALLEGISCFVRSQERINAPLQD